MNRGLTVIYFTETVCAVANRWAYMALCIEHMAINRNDALTDSSRAVISNIMEERSEIWRGREDYDECCLLRCDFCDLVYSYWTFKVRYCLTLQGRTLPLVMLPSHPNPFYSLHPPRWRRHVYLKVKTSTKLHDVTWHFIVFFNNYVPARLRFCISLSTELTEFRKIQLGTFKD